jgi:3-hydroxyisobutyrate dehydrogenase-like beta-hydroxyacid dehydrogenase
MTMRPRGWLSDAGALAVKPSAVLVEYSTMTPTGTRSKLTGSRKGSKFLDAPVTGSKAAAANERTLRSAVMRHRSAVRPVLASAAASHILVQPAQAHLQADQQHDVGGSNRRALEGRRC